jgi:hypothetical protein
LRNPGADGELRDELTTWQEFPARPSREFTRTEQGIYPDRAGNFLRTEQAIPASVAHHCVPRCEPETLVTFNVLQLMQLVTFNVLQLMHGCIVHAAIAISRLRPI